MKSLMEKAVDYALMEEAMRNALLPPPEPKQEYMAPVMQLRAAEQQAEAQPEAQAIRSPPRLTQIIDIRDRALTRGLRFLNISGEGILDEVLIIAEKPSFSVNVSVDGAAIVDGAYTHYRAYSSDMESIDAYDYEGKYIFKFHAVDFTSSIQVTVEPGESMIFNVLFAKYTLLEG